MDLSAHFFWIKNLKIQKKSTKKFKQILKIFFGFLVIFLQKVFSNYFFVVWFSKIPYFFLDQIFLTQLAEKKETNLNKHFCIFLRVICYPCYEIAFFVGCRCLFSRSQTFFLFSIPKWGDVSFQHRGVLNRTLIYDCSFSFRFRHLKKNYWNSQKKKFSTVKWDFARTLQSFLNLT